jgi:hypothetical protein
MNEYMDANYNNNINNIELYQPELQAAVLSALGLLKILLQPASSMLIIKRIIVMMLDRHSTVDLNHLHCKRWKVNGWWWF